MRNLLRCRRGSVAFATVAGLVPVIGAIALGAEAGSWYVTKQHAHNAADAAAYSGALTLACSLAPSSCSDAEPVDYRGKEFAAQNGFCDASDTNSYPGSRCLTSHPKGISQAVTIATLTSWNGTNGNFVQATVSQQQPAYLATLLGSSTVNIGATAVAEVVTLAKPCVLTLRDSLSFQGAPTVQSPNCGLASNNTTATAITFTGNNGINVTNVGSISAQGGCAETGGTQCNKALTYAPPVPNPLSGLNTPMSNVTIATPCSSGNNVLPTAYDTTKGQACVNAGFTFRNNGGPTNNGQYPLNGVYFFSGNLRIQGGTISFTKPTPPQTCPSPCGVTFVLLPGASLRITGTPTIQLTAPSTIAATQVPAALAAVVGLMSDLLIYDPETTTTNQSVNISGNASSYFNGVTYLPNADVTYQGSTQTFGCTEVIALGITLSGDSNFDNAGCPANLRPQSNYVKLVQ